MQTQLKTELWSKFSNIKEIDSKLNREINNLAAGNTVTAVRNKLSPETAENLVIFNELLKNLGCTQQALELGGPGRAGLLFFS